MLVLFFFFVHLFFLSKLLFVNFARANKLFFFDKYSRKPIFVFSKTATQPGVSTRARKFHWSADWTDSQKNFHSQTISKRAGHSTRKTARQRHTSTARRFLPVISLPRLCPPRRRLSMLEIVVKSAVCHAGTAKHSIGSTLKYSTSASWKSFPRPAFRTTSVGWPVARARERENVMLENREPFFFPPAVVAAVAVHSCALSANRVDRTDREKVCRELSDAPRVQSLVDASILGKAADTTSFKCLAI